MKPKWYHIWMRSLSIVDGEEIQQDLAVEAVDDEHARKLATQLVKEGWEILSAEPLMSTEGVY